MEILTVGANFSEGRGKATLGGVGIILNFGVEGFSSFAFGRDSISSPIDFLFALSSPSDPTPEAPAPRKRSFFSRLLLFLVATFLVVVGVSNVWVVGSTYGRVYHSADEIPRMPVGIVLGTSKKVAPDEANPHFENRIAAAAELYRSGKVRHLLVSGHRDSKYYDEPRDMTAKLVELGVPTSAITPDNAGLRTLDSMVRAHEIYRLDQVTVISDDFHVPRALFIADHRGIEAIALRGERVPFRQSLKARAREYFARVKAVIDLFFLGTEPAKLGEPQEILVLGPGSDADED